MKHAIVAITIASIFLVSAGLKAEEQEGPSYKVLKTYQDFELRSYDPYIVAEMEVKGSFQEASYAAFPVLVDYIGGNNKKKEEIAMKSPVEQAPAEGEKIAMTSPVTQAPGAGKTYKVSFVMPREYTMETVPTPVDERIEMKEVPAKLMAARKYSGRWTTDNYEENLRILMEGIEREGLKPLSTPVWARYDSPFTLWWNRRNEVMIEVDH